MNIPELEKAVATIVEDFATLEKPLEQGAFRDQATVNRTNEIRRLASKRLKLNAIEIAVGIGGAFLDIRDSLATIAGLYEGRNDDGRLLPNDRRR